MSAPPRTPAPSDRPKLAPLVALVAFVAGAALVGLHDAFDARDRAPRAATATLAAPAPATGAPSAPAASAAPQGFVDQPAQNTIVGTRLALSGWAVAPDGVARVEVRIDGVAHAARIGLPRDDVARERPELPAAARSGFAFEGDFPLLTPMRHDVEVVAIATSGAQKVIGRRSVLPPEALTQWSALLAERRALAAQPFFFLMMTSAVGHGGAAEVDTEYAAYRSGTQRVGISVPILYLRSTKGAAHDWTFDADFPVDGPKCGTRPVTEDNLAGVIAYALEKRVPVQFILNGGIWSDASCETPEWDLTDHLEQDRANVQWTQSNADYPDNFLKNNPGSTESPELARTLTYNVYAAKVRAYKKRNLQAASRIVGRFAREHPELFVGVVLDADTYMNPFYYSREMFDYNPGMVRQFREWLRGDGPYAGHPRDGAPDLSAYRRAKPLTLADVNRIARQQWKRWDEVDPPRHFPGWVRDPLKPGDIPIWQDPWWHEWDRFRRHIIDLHYDELSRWTSEAGVPPDRIFSAQGITAPDPGLKPIAVTLASDGPDYDSAGVSIEGAIPSHGHLGGVIYGPAARNETPMESPWSLFATLARMDEGWGLVETNSTDLKQPKVKPPYEWTYRTFRDAFNYSSREISIMAWNGSNGLLADHPDYLPYTAWRNTPNEDAMRDFLASHADLPFGAKLWTFGSATLASDDGWTATRGRLVAERGRLALTPDRDGVELLSPADQVIRPRRTDLALVRAFDGAKPARIVVHARGDRDGRWYQVGAADGGERVDLRWPPALADTLVTQLRLELFYPPGTTAAHVDRVLIYPKADAFRGGIRHAAKGK